MPRPRWAILHWGRIGGGGSRRGLDCVLAVIPMQQVTELRGDARHPTVAALAPSGVPMIAES
jgi:hypothetical protein